ncbi:hypothetical protein AJ79_07440 [Helicocarpus griseus UAMH5409]|uniref:DUF4604 domain-containing protein n=1 Tax=Helicocarpus griseus UAMH5409 TaxID=1447875 RepID=A0A2B7X2U3_9EURO|nr:hypothetical protein AJ79_07440 [Helicocarpus griseus UAMH5409]
MAFNAKNLSYEKKEPAFLRKLRGEYGNGGGFRNDRPNPRPTKKRDADDDDDAPTYVDEASNEVISKEEYEALVKGDDDDKVAEDLKENEQGDNNGQANTAARDETEGRAKVASESAKSKQKQQVAEIGGAKKRKQGKVIGEDAAAEEEVKKPQTSRKPKLKKKIKLSFDDEE